jgi:citrate lyase beta subunit
MTMSSDHNEATLGVQSLLFVPGSRPDRFTKALASGADCVCVDLEDAVPPEGKDQARAAALAAVAEAPQLAIRINAVHTPAGQADLVALAEATVRPRMLLLPMVEEVAEVEIVRDALGGNCMPLVPLIETVRGLGNAGAIAADPAVGMVMFGGADFSAELGVPLTWEATAVARSQLVMACAGAGKAAIDVPFIALDDAAGLAEECRRAKAIGFAAKAAIHPAQIAGIHAAFRPTGEEIAEAMAAEEAFRAAGGAAVRFNGKMLEIPVMRRYRRILALKEAIDA